MFVLVMMLATSKVLPNGFWKFYNFVNGLLPRQILKVHLHSFLNQKYGTFSDFLKDQEVRLSHGHVKVANYQLSLGLIAS